VALNFKHRVILDVAHGKNKQGALATSSIGLSKPISVYVITFPNWVLTTK